MGPWVSDCGHVVLLFWLYGQTEHGGDYCSTQGSQKAKGTEGGEEESSSIHFKDASRDLISSLPIGRNSLNSHLPPMAPRANDLTFSNIS